MKEQMYLISEDKLIELLTAQHELNCLVEAGVDNWSWYMVNREDYIMNHMKNIPENPEDFDFDFDDCATDDLINFTKVEI